MKLISRTILCSCCMLVIFMHRYDCTCYGSNGCTNAVGVQNISTMSAHECSQGSTAWECWHDATAHKTGGMWYSTTDKGYCGDGTHPPPPNCTWRVAQFIKRVNKTCSDNVRCAHAASSKPSCVANRYEHPPRLVLHLSLHSRWPFTCCFFLTSLLSVADDGFFS